VVFDLAEVFHWTQEMGQRCMDCHKEMKSRVWEGPREPWRVVNEHQVQCDPCHIKAAPKPATINPLQLALLREATQGVCPVCGETTGIVQIAEGEKIPMVTTGPAGFLVHEECAGKPIRLPDGTLLGP
jgi:hypothetical protein